ncbi:uncharacterized protein LOC131958196 [Physella acuta]|uniref:uncharacterized protein LOC131958196 n=1 Tax=Physella acuta TaxID=109671 RepID=UPI0027DE9380|nr:uncharacterized protein LOC131958196 [Physella acuta]
MKPLKIVFMLFTVLLNISQLSGKENYCKQFPKLEILKYYMQFNSIDLVLTIKILFSMVSDNVSEEMHLDEVETEKLIFYIKYASAKDKRKHKGFRLIKLIKGLAKLAISEKTKLKIKTCFETFITILQKSEPEELESTIECLQAISTHNTESYKIVEDKMLVKTLSSLQDKATDSIKSKVNSVLWESGNTSGIFPEFADNLSPGSQHFIKSAS